MKGEIFVPFSNLEFIRARRRCLVAAVDRGDRSTKATSARTSLQCQCTFPPSFLPSFLPSCATNMLQRHERRDVYTAAASRLQKIPKKKAAEEQEHALPDMTKRS